MTPDVDFFEELQKAIKESWPAPKMLILNFPGNPTTQCVDLDFFEKVVAICRENEIWLVHDLAYADIVFDGYKAPSVMQVPGAKDVARSEAHTSEPQSQMRISYAVFCLK